MRFQERWRTASGVALILVSAALTACSGEDGANGAQGTPGAPGDAGVKGSNGDPGDPGATGPSGDPGDPGDPGATGPQGDPGATGPQGDPGATGPQGDAGVQGDAGPTGPGGQDGLGIVVDQLHGAAALEKAALVNDGKFIVEASVLSATADAAGVVTVDFKVQNKDGTPLLGLTGPSFNIAKLAPAPAAGQPNHWEAYIYRTETVAGTTYPNPDGTKADQAYSEKNGTLTDNGDGTYTYVFATNISAITTPVAGTAISYDRARLHRISVMMGGHTGPTATATFDFVPDGSAASDTRDIVDTASCRNCHGEEFHAHGGDRLTVENCTTCHTPASADAQSGNTLDLKVMIHKIHAGGELATIPGPDGKVWDDPATAVDESADNGEYAIWGYQNIKQTWWKVGFPADISNCAKCHNGSQANVNNWKTVPSRAACGSCHDNVDFATGANHPDPGGIQTTDANCTACHGSGSANPWTPTSNTIPDRHEFTKVDPRNIPEYTATMTVTGAANGQYFVKGETPQVHIVLKDYKTGTTLDHTTILSDDAVTAIPPGDGAEGCIPNAAGTDCTIAADSKFTSSALFVNGPRARQVPVLTTKARAVVKSTQPGPYALNDAAFKTSLNLVVDNGFDIFTTDSGGGDLIRYGAISVPLYTSGGTGEFASWTGSQFVDANQQLMGANRSWRNHQYAGYTIVITNNSVSGKPTQSLSVLDNVGATMTLSGPINGTAGDVLTYAMTGFASNFANIGTSGSANTIVDSTQSWKTDQWKGFSVRVVTGSGTSATGVSITGNTATTLTLASALPAAADNTSVYSIQPIGNPSAATPADVVTWLNANVAFKARAIAYIENLAVADTMLAAVAVGGTTFSVKTGNGVMFPASGSVILDRFTSSEETLAYTRTGDVFTIAPATKAHAAKATLRVNVASAPVIRSRNLGELFAVQIASSSVIASSQIFPTEVVGNYPIHILGSNNPGATTTTGTLSTVSNSVALQTDTFTNDPKVTLTTGEIVYTLDPVDDLTPGTYTAKIEFANRGNRVVDVDYKTPTNVRVTFQVGTATEEPAPANMCGSCHTDPTDTKGLVVDYTRHYKLLDNTAGDLCGSCHDYQSGATAGDWSGAKPISKRVHGIHFGSSLNYPLDTIGYANGDSVKGRNWDITFPQDVRNCDTTCHGPTTSGSWKTKPARLPCSGCHDSDSAKAHFKQMTYDPTPANQYSGDEIESCATCHAAAN